MAVDSSICVITIVSLYMISQLEDNQCVKIKRLSADTDRQLIDWSRFKSDVQKFFCACTSQTLLHETSHNVLESNMQYDGNFSYTQSNLYFFQKKWKKSSCTLHDRDAAKHAHNKYTLVDVKLFYLCVPFLLHELIKCPLIPPGHLVHHHSVFRERGKKRFN